MFQNLLAQKQKNINNYFCCSFPIVCFYRRCFNWDICSLDSQSIYKHRLVNSFLNFILENKSLILIIVFLRYFFQYNQNMIIKKIEQNADKNLKCIYLKRFLKKKYSVADSYFYINVLSGHVAFFYSSFASFLNSFLQILAYTFYLMSADPRSITILIVGSVILFYPVRKLLKLAKNYIHITYEKGKESNEEIARVVENLFLLRYSKKKKMNYCFSQIHLKASNRVC